MVDIPIKNRNFLSPVCRLSVACTDGYIIEETEAQRLITLCMVSRWPNRTECRIEGSVKGSINGAENTPCSKECSVKGLADSIGVSTVKEAASAVTDLADVFDMMLCVNRAKLVNGSRSQIQVYKVLAQSACTEVSVHPPQPIRSFRMSGGRQMPKKGIA